MTYHLSKKYSAFADLSLLDLEFANPWQHFVLDDLFDSPDFHNIQRNTLQTDSDFKIQQEDPEQIQYQALPDMILARTLLSTEFTNLIQKITQTKLTLFQKGSLQLRRMTPSSPPFPPHHDFISERTLVMLYYLSPNWSPDRGGRLFLHKDEASSRDPNSFSHYIAPKENRMVLFFNDCHHWHSVEPVSNWQRYLVFAEWLVHD